MMGSSMCSIWNCWPKIIERQVQSSGSEIHPQTHNDTMPLASARGIVLIVYYQTVGLLHCNRKPCGEHTPYDVGTEEHCRGCGHLLYLEEGFRNRFICESHA